MKEITIHQAVDAIRAGKTVYVAKSAAKAFFLSEFMDSDKFFVEETAEEPKKELKNSSQELKKSTQEPKKTGAEPIIPSSEYDIIMESRRAGETYDQIGARYGCTGATVKNFLVREGKKRAEKEDTK